MTLVVGPGLAGGISCASGMMLKTDEELLEEALLAEEITDYDDSSPELVDLDTLTEDEQNSADPAALKVVQVSIFKSGKYTEDDQQKITWDTAHRFAKTIRAIGNVAIVGMQNVTDSKVRDILIRETNQKWEMTQVAQGANSLDDGLAVLWRPDLVERIADLGSSEIERLDDNRVVRFMGQLFARVGSTGKFGFFTGRFSASDEGKVNGRSVDEAIREAEAGRVLRWVSTIMNNYESSPRVVALDLNDAADSAAWNKMSSEFDDGGSQLPTWNSFKTINNGMRRDSIWYRASGSSKAISSSSSSDSDASEQPKGGFLEGPRRSTHFGSDHRMVWAQVHIP